MMNVERLGCVVMALTMLSAAAWAQKPCEELKTEIDAKLQAKGTENYSLDIVTNDAVKDQKVVGSCEGGSKKIVYARSSTAKTETTAPNP
jgi:hypothetical protein